MRAHHGGNRRGGRQQAEQAGDLQQTAAADRSVHQPGEKTDNEQEQDFGFHQSKTRLVFSDRHYTECLSEKTIAKALKN